MNNIEATRIVIMAKIFELGHTVQKVDEITEGPVLTVFRVLPVGKTKVSHLESMAEDFAITLGVEAVTVGRISGEASVGIWVPNKVRQFIDFKQAMTNFWSIHKTMDIPLNLGIDHIGKPVIVDLATLPHLLICGSTGGGKSALVHGILASLMYCVPSEQLQMILSDTKRVEFGHFLGSPHLMYDPAKTVWETLQRIEWLISEMERRFILLERASKRNIKEYNAAISPRLPYILLVFDELADLLSDKSKSGDKGPGVGKLAESMLATLTQKSRAVGIHIIACTQRPSVKVVEGNIKANFPARLSFRLPSGTDSRTVLDADGAEHLLVPGDCLYKSPARPGLIRVHTPYAKAEDIIAAVEMASMRERSNANR